MSGEAEAGSLAFLAAELRHLEAESLLRTPRVADVEAGGAALDVLCSNDYLGYGAHPLPADSTARSGSGASPLVVGYHQEHLDAELALAEWLGQPAALLFSSGYAANLGTIAALVGRGDVVISDALNHASIIDGCRLSGATVEVTPHLDVTAVASVLQKHRAARRRLVVSEAYFSMDADGPDLAALRAVCSREGAILMVDEAHSLGVEGPEGRGRCAAAGILADVTVGTLGKSLGLHGAFVLGSAALRLFLWNRARPLVFSTATSPALVAAVPGRVRSVRADDAARTRVHALAARVRRDLGLQGWDLRGEGPIIPVVVGEAGRALDLAARLRGVGLVVQAIRPPTVPTGSARLRLTMGAGHGDEVIDRLVNAFRTLG